MKTWVTAVFSQPGGTQVSGSGVRTSENSDLTDSGFFSDPPKSERRQNRRQTQGGDTGWYDPAFSVGLSTSLTSSARPCLGTSQILRLVGEGTRGSSLHMK